MRPLLAFLATLLTAFAALAQNSPFPPSPKQLVAVDPILNKVYVANESGNSVTVLNGATNTTVSIPVGSRPQFISVNPITHRVFVNNGGEASLTVIDGTTNTNLTPTPLPLGTQGPMAVNVESNLVYIVRMTSVATDEVTFFNASDNTWYTIATESFQPTAVAVNPVTDTIYVAHYGTGDVRVISGAWNPANVHPTTFSIGAWSKPFAVAANSATNRIYVITEDARGPIGIINGATRAAVWPLPAAGHATGPKALAVNPVTNRIYAAFAGEVIVIDGSTNGYTYIPVDTGSGPASIGINHFTNKIYVSGAGGTLTVIDGGTNATTTVPIPGGTTSLGVNPMTNEVIVAGGATDIVDGATGTFMNVGITTTVNPLPGNTSGPTGSVTMTATNSLGNPLPIRGVYFQLDSLEGAWSAASGTGPYTATFSGLAPGPHALYAFAAEAHVASTDTGPQASPLFGNITTYNFTVSGGLANAAVSLASSANPSLVGQSVTFTAAVTGSGATPTGTVRFSDGATTLCSAVTLAAGSASCTTTSLPSGSRTITASYSGDSGYNPANGTFTQTVNLRTATASVSSSQTPSLVGQSVTFTATVTGGGGTPTGTVTFVDGTTTLCSAVALSAGSASCAASSLASGNHTITANYSGNSTYSTASGTVTQTVNKAAATVSLTTPATVEAGRSATIGAGVSGSTPPGAPTGTVAFLDGSTTIAGCGAVALVSGNASCTATFNSTGTHTIVARYSGDARYDSRDSGSKAIEVVTPLGATPTTISPSGTVTTTTPAYSWSATSGATSYDLLVQTPGGADVYLVTFTASASGCGAGTGTCTVTPSPALANGGSYNWFVRAKNSVNMTGFSPARAFTVSVPTPPAAPTTMSPTGTVSTLTPTFVWNAVSGAASYDLLLQTPGGADTFLADYTAAAAGCSSGSGTCSITPSNAVADGNSYNWFVRAKNASGASGWSMARAITVNAGPTEVVPSAPMLMSPSGSIPTTTPAYSWAASSGAASYTLILQDRHGTYALLAFSAAEAGCAGGSGTCSVTPSKALVNGEQYNWAVRASNNAGTSGWSASFTITVSPATTAPATPTTIAPEGPVTTATPTYTWNAVPGAELYHFLIQAPSGADVLLIAYGAAEAGCAGGGVCSVTPGMVLADGASYYWFVAAQNSAGTSTWSQGRFFTVDADPSGTPPATPTLGYPSGNVPTRTPTFYWSASSGATSYDLILQSPQGTFALLDFTPSQAGCAGGVGACGITLASPLAANTQYNWAVRAWNSAGTRGWSASNVIRTP